MAGSHVSVVHALLSLHGGLAVKTQPEAGSQLSVVQAFWSSHVIGANTQPVAGLQLSAVQALLSLQVTGV